jgi:Peptidase family M23
MVFPLFLLSVLLPLVSIVLLWRRPRRPAAGWVATFILATGLVGFAVLVAPWGVFGVPLRFVIILFYVSALVRSLRRPVPAEEREESPVRHIIKALVGLLFGMVGVGVLASHAVPAGAIDLQFPLKDGTFLVAHGGSESASNMHAYDKAQRYGLDIVKLTAAGTRARGLFPSDLTRYAIWGADVLSPCDGTVVKAVDGLPDNPLGTRDEKNKEGNHVVVRCGDANVLLAHLQRGSVAVRPNARVAAGTLLGRAGNSGNTTEPHLHIHADRDGTGVPARFGGRWLVRNAIVRR